MPKFQRNVVADNVKLYHILSIELCLIYVYFESIRTHLNEKDTKMICFNFRKVLGTKLQELIKYGA